MAALTVPVLAPAAAEATGHPAHLVGVFIGIIYVGAMASSLVSGSLIGWLGPIRISQICLILCAAGLSLLTFGGLLHIAAGAVLIGFGYGPVTPASSHILARTTPAHRIGLTFSLKQTGVPLGSAMAGVLVPPAVVAWRWEGAALGVAGFCLAMALVSESVRRPLDADRGASAKYGLSPARLFAPFRLIFSLPALRDIALCSFFFGAVQLCLTTYLVIWLTRDYGMDLLSAGLMMALAQGGGIGGRLLWGWLADRLGAPRVVLSGLGVVIGLCMLAFALVGSSWPVPVVAAIILLAGATAIGWNGVYLAEVARLSPAGLASTVTGGALFFTYFGVVAGPPSFAAILSATGDFSESFLTIGLCILAVGLYLGLTRTRPIRK